MTMHASTPHIFISYSAKDSEVAQAVCAALEAQGLSCWIAPRNILPGSDWSRSIIEGLNACQAMVLIYSAHSNESPQVANEVERAVHKRIPLLPLRIEDVPLSPQMEYFISSSHWLDAHTLLLEPHLQRLVEAVRGLLTNLPSTETAAPVSAIPASQASPERPTPPGQPLFPTGTVTFLFTDIEGSTKLWEQHPDTMRLVLARHDGLVRQAIQTNGGTVFKTVGDAFCAAFATASEALQAALDAQNQLQQSLPASTAKRLALLVRMALHTGAAEPRDADYFGPPLNRVARLLAIGHGGQVLMSQTTRELVAASLPVEASLQDLGWRRLKDLQQPEHVWQLRHPGLPADFPPLRSLPAFATNLPIQPTSFIGRDAEMQQVQRLLESTPLLTLTGSGGCGKTRLALQLAAEVVEQYPDGVWLGELAALSDPALLPQRVASALGLCEEPGRSLTETVTDYLKPKTLLLVLDNCEHLLVACAALSDRLLRSCPQVRLLTTSREALNLGGETIYRVPPLLQPDPHALPLEEKEYVSVLAEYDAVRLFVERAKAQRSDFALTRQNGPAVAEVCIRLDGIPLAIELAAVRARAMAVDQIAARLEDRFGLLTRGSRMALPRQQTLKATLDWSYDLLNEPEQFMLRRLSVFAGGWTLEAAERVCAGAGIGAREVLELLTSLVDQSLVVFEESEGNAGAHYRLLETIRQYGQERLAESGESAELRSRHRDYFLALAEETEPKLYGPEQEVWLERLDVEQENLRSALDWCRAEEAGAEAGLRLTGALSWFWEVRGYASEGRAYLAEALKREGAAGRTQVRAKALNAAGNLAANQGDPGAAKALYEESVVMYRELGYKQGIAGSLHHLGIVAEKQGDPGAAKALHEESLAIWRELEHKQEMAIGLLYLGQLARRAGDYEQAHRLLTECLELDRQLSLICFRRADPVVAELGGLAADAGDYAQARRWFEQSLREHREIDDPQGSAAGLEAFAHLAQQQREWERAARLGGAVEALRAAICSPLALNQREEYEHIRAAVREALGEEAFAAAWTEGRAMSMEQAIEYALQEAGSTHKSV